MIGDIRIISKINSDGKNVKILQKLITTCYDEGNRRIEMDTWVDVGEL